MKRYLVVGLGHFGSWVARSIYALGHEVIAIEKREDLVDRHADTVTRGVVGDATDQRLLKEIGAENVDAAIISCGDDLATTILATLALRDLGVDALYVKVTSPEAARAVTALKAKETIFPEREAAYNLAHRIASHAVLKYIPVAEGYSIQEIAIPDRWLGKTLRELELRQRHGIQVVAIFDVLTNQMRGTPDPDEPLKDSDVVIVAGPDDTLSALLGERRRRT